jgi:1,4-alpha-glucan branching enzyme
LAAAACLLLTMGLFLRQGFAPGNRVPAGLSSVTFVLAAPSAREVAVIGSFNGWNSAGWTMVRDQSRGLWTLSSALPPGSHEYVFLIDGTTPVADTMATLNVDDGFGGRNSVLLVKDDHGTAL